MRLVCAFSGVWVCEADERNVDIIIRSRYMLQNHTLVPDSIKD